MLIGLLNVQFLSHHFTISEFGLYQLLMTIIGVFSVASLTGYDNLARRHMINGNDAYILYVYRSVLPVVICILGIIGLAVYFYVDFHKQMTLVALAIVSLMIFDKLGVVLSAKLRFLEYRYFELGGRVAFLGLTICTIAINLAFETFLYLLLALHMAHYLLRAVIALKWVERRASLSSTEITEFNRGALRNSLVIGYATFASWIERLILGFLSPAQLAVFSIGYLITKLVKDNVKAFLTPTLYNWSRRGSELQYLKIEQHKSHFLGIGLLFFFLVAGGGYWTIHLFFPKYQEATLISGVLAIVLVPIFVVYAMAHAMLMSDHIETSNRVEIISNTLKIFISPILVYFFLLWGAAASIIISESVRLGLYYFYFKKIVRGLRVEINY